MRRAGAELVSLAPMRFNDARSPDGALFYKIALDDLYVGEIPPAGVEGRPGGTRRVGDGATVPVPPVFEPLGMARAHRHPDCGRGSPTWHRSTCRSR